MRRDPAAPRRPRPPGFGAIWTCVALDLVGFGIVLPILPIYATRFAATPTTIGLLVASFSLAQLVFAPVWGGLSDRIGRKPVLVVSLAGTAGASLLTGLAGSLWVLFAARILDGVSGASVSVAQAAVVDVAPAADRARLLGLLSAAFGVGFVVGPGLGAVTALVDPRLPFFLAALVAGANAVWAVRRLPETHPVRRSAPSSVSPPVADPSPLLAGPSQRSGAGTYVAVAFASLVAFSAFEATFALFGQRRLGFDEASTAGVFVGIGVLITAVQLGLVGRCVDRFGEQRALRLGLALNAVGLLVLADVRSWVALVPALVLVTAGQGLLTPTLSSLVAGRVAAERRGGALGIQQAVGGLARVTGPAVGGFLFQRAGVPVPYLVGAGLTAGAALLLVTTVPTVRPGAPAAAR
ncbi:MAG: MFS transporter [Acidimicrobiales bacterium]